MAIYVSRVVDVEVKPPQTYEVAPTPLGGGMTSNVYLGTNVGSGQRIAVKVSLGTNPSFAAEAYWLQTLAAHPLAKNAVPWAHIAQPASGPVVDILLMEYVPDEWQLSRQYVGGGLPEEVALNAAVQYARLLAAMSELNCASFGDRKATDFRWKPDVRRLIVVDWGGVKDMSGDDRGEAVQQEIAFFGRIWIGRMLGREVKELPLLDDASELWARHYRGFRQVLLRAALAPGYVPYRDAVELQGEIEQCAKEVEEASRISEEECLMELELAMSAGSDTLKSNSEEKASRALNQIDLLMRRQSRIVPDRYDKIRAWARQELELPGVEAQRAIRQVHSSFDVQDYRTALSVAQASRARAAENPALTLSLLRLEIVAKAGIDGNACGADVKTVIKELVNIADRLEQTADVVSPNQSNDGLLKTIDEDIARARRAYPAATTTDYLKYLEGEVRIRRGLMDNALPEHDPIRLRDELIGVAGYGQAYGALLTKVFPRLAKRLQDEVRKGIRSRQEEEALRAFELAARAALKRPLDRGAVLVARKAWQAAGRTVSALEPHEWLAEATDWLCKINDSRDSARFDDALRAANAWPAKLSEDSAARRIVQAACRRDVIEGVVSPFWKAGPKIPEEIERAEALVDLLRLSELDKEQCGLVDLFSGELQKARAKISDYQVRFIALLSDPSVIPGSVPGQLGLSSGVSIDTIVEAPSVLDALLREMLDNRLELFRGIHEDRLRPLRAERLLALRQDHSLLLAAERLRESLAGIELALQPYSERAGEVGATVSAWSRVAAAMDEERLGHLSTALTLAKEQSEEWARIDAQMPAPGNVDIRLNDLESLRAKTASATETIATLKRKLGEIEKAQQEALGRLQRLVGEREVATSSLSSARATTAAVSDAVENHHLMSGLASVRALDLERAKAALSHLNEADSPAAMALKNEVEWLATADRIESIDMVRNWQLAIISRDLARADECRTSVFAAFAKTGQTAWSSFLMELELSHQRLALPVPTVPNDLERERQIETKAFVDAFAVLEEYSQSGNEEGVAQQMAAFRGERRWSAYSMLTWGHAQLSNARHELRQAEAGIKQQATAESMYAAWRRLATLTRSVPPVVFSWCFPEWKELVSALEPYVAKLQGAPERLAKLRSDASSSATLGSEELMAIRTAFQNPTKRGKSHGQQR